jgi:hypothetical protein
LSAISFFSPDFLRQLFALPEFPSNDPTFPVDQLLASQSCVDSISFKILFDVFSRTKDDDLMTQLFDQLIGEDDDPVLVLNALSIDERID